MGLAWSRIFCHHKLEEVQKLEIKDKLGNTVEIRVIYMCKECGKLKTTQI